MADPMRADHRFMQSVITSSFAGLGVDPTPSDLDRVGQVFQKAGGRWEQVFLGNVAAVNLLKKTLKVAIQRGHVTKSPDWGA